MSSHHEIEELLGAYALDAVDRNEALLVEEHLAECPRCRAEVAEHREVAALLAGGASGEVPEGLWDRIAADLGDAPPAVPIEFALGLREAKASRARGRPAQFMVGLAAAAVVVVLALVGGVLIKQRTEIHDLQDEVVAAKFDSRVADAVARPGTRVVTLVSDETEAEARAVVDAEGDGFLLADMLPDLGAGQTYQLWGLPQGRDEMVSLGVLGPDPDIDEFHVEGEITAFAVTREPGGGSTQPTTDPYVTGTLT